MYLVNEDTTKRIENHELSTGNLKTLWHAVVSRKPQKWLGSKIRHLVVHVAFSIVMGGCWNKYHLIGAKRADRY